MNKSFSALKAMKSVKRFSEVSKEEHCELCGERVFARHQHLMDPKTRKLCCSCDGCATLFDEQGATKLRRVPRDTKYLKNFQLSSDSWKKLEVPINLAFFYRDSRLQGKIIALYPSAGGALESVPPEASWEELLKLNPEIAAMTEDVEALLINRLHNRLDVFIAPIDRCFELVGIIRTHWRGFVGGDQVWKEVNGFLEQLAKEARP
jgi:hypothetical protein